MSVFVGCNQCGKTFPQDAYKAKRNKTNYCSLQCRREYQRQSRLANMGTYQCEHCGDGFQRAKYEAARSENLFCTYECSREFFKNRTVVTCEWCGDDVEKMTRWVEQNTNNFCSYACAASWKKDRARTVVVCPECGESFSIKISRLDRDTNYNFCSVGCRNRFYSAERSPAWNGGSTFHPYPPEFNNSLKRFIRKRDRHTCQVCGRKHKRGKPALHVHHINYLKDDCSTINLLTVCVSCNSRLNFNRHIWQRVLEALQRARGVN